MQVAERSKQVVVKSKDGNMLPKSTEDKRPSKEREEARRLGLDQTEKKFDIDFEKYGYARPEKIRSGHMSLRQFDEFLDEYKSNKTSEVISRRADEFKIDKAEIGKLLEYFKPLYQVSANKPPADKVDADPNAPPHFQQVFSNVKKLGKEK